MFDRHTPDRDPGRPAFTPAVDPFDQSRRDHAAVVRRTLRDRCTLLFEFAGVPGSGRTSLLAATLRRLHGEAQVGVVLADPGNRCESEHLLDYCRQLVRVDVPELDSADVRRALGQFDLDALEWLFCEGTGLALDPGDGDVGQNLTIAVFGVAGGDDKPAALPYLCVQADAVVLTQMDLLPHVPFRMDRFESDLRHLNPRAPIFPVSTVHGTGMREWLDWLRRYRISKNPMNSPDTAGDDVDALLHVRGEWYIG